MTDEGDYAVDPEELQEVIQELKDCKAVLVRNLADLRANMRILQDTWEGLSAHAQAEAQAEMQQGMETMNLALEDLIAANETAHGNYTAAWQANVAMWQALQ